MKSEYVDERDIKSNPNPSLHSNTNTNTMFSKFHQPPPPQQQPPHLHPQYHPFPFPFSKDSQTSEEADSTATPPSKKPKSDDGGGGETIELARRPRGRPPGSKNKPKPPVVITREPDAPSMSPYILEIPTGGDIIESLVRLTQRRGMGLCVLSGSGPVSNVTLLQPSGGGGGTVTFHGQFDLASLSAVLLPGGSMLGGQNCNNSVGGGGFTVTLSAPQGHIVGGKVVGPLMASGTVYVVAASFNNPTFHKLPLGDDDTGVGDEGGQQQQQESSPVVSGGSGGEGSGGGEMTGSAPVMYSCQVGGGADVIWAPTARPPHQHPPPPPPY